MKMDSDKYDFIRPHLKKGVTYERFLERMQWAVRQIPADAWELKTRRPHEAKDTLNALHTKLAAIIENDFAVEILSCHLRAVQSDPGRKSPRIIPDDCIDYRETTRAILCDLLKASDQSNQKTNKGAPAKAASFYIGLLMQVYSECVGKKIPGYVHQSDPFWELCRSVFDLKEKDDALKRQINNALKKNLRCRKAKKA